MVGEELVKLLFDKEWYPMIFVFKFMCLSEIIRPLSAVNSYVHGAQGRPKWHLGINLIMVLFMPISFFFVVPFGLNSIIIPWLTTYLIISIGWIIVTIRKIGVSALDYMLNLSVPVGGILFMSVSVWAYKKLRIYYTTDIGLTDLIFLIIIGGGT